MGVRAGLLSAVALLGGLAVGAAWLAPAPAAPAAEPDGVGMALPLPPIPPRIAQDGRYDACLGAIAGDPAAAIRASYGWRGDGALHCRGLALVAQGELAQGAAVLEALAAGSDAPAVARAAVDGQASQAWLLAGQTGRALAAAAAGIALSPDDPDLLVDHAMAADRLGESQTVIDDLDRAVDLDPHRADALTLRAAAWRRLGEPELAQDDAARAAAAP
jgi:tetratricopeptide (TPR) repeat protein